jgi:hypothetical protein
VGNIGVAFHTNKKYGGGCEWATAVSGLFKGEVLVCTFVTSR